MPDRARRFTAAVIDGLIGALLTVLLGGAPLIGGLVGAIYLVVRDGINVGPVRYRSVGKHLMGLGLVRLDGRSVNLEVSVQRNWMFGLGALGGLLGAVPIVGGLLAPLVSLAGMALLAFEVYNVFSDPAGRRWGDRLGNTKVVETGSPVF